MNTRDVFWDIDDLKWSPDELEQRLEIAEALRALGTGHFTQWEVAKAELEIASSKEDRK